ncbi:MAG: hypothetical protein ACEPOZ_08605 [Marinifilaceae bacterium]
MEVLIIGVVAIALIAFGVTYFGKSKKEDDEDEVKEVNDECCGAHEICETDLLAKMSTEIVYYEDQELDAYQNYEEDDYSDEQIDEFREVLYSLKEKEIEGWLHSLELRHIVLPSIIKSELVFMMVNN